MLKFMDVIKDLDENMVEKLFEKNQKQMKFRSCLIGKIGFTYVEN